MTVFEIVFGLISVILGLALTQMVGNLHRLALAGRRVRWAPEPLLLAILIFMIISQVWIDQWNEHNERSIAIGILILQVLKMMTIFFAAASVLPESVPEEASLDLVDYYYRTRHLTYGAMIVGLFLFYLYGALMYPQPFRIADFAIFMIAPTIYATLIWFRRRPYHIAALVFVIVVFGSQILTLRIGK